MTDKTISPEDLVELERAKRLLENPGFIARVANIIGMPLEKAMEALPPRASQAIEKAAHAAISSALKASLKTFLKQPKNKRNLKWLHKLLVGVTGAAGGFFGWAALAAELPVSTMIMLRSIAAIARANGEDLHKADTQVACVMVFALGGPKKSDDASESGYYAVRMALAKTVTEAAKYIAEKGLAEEGAPVLVRLIATIAARFGVIVSEKAAAVMIPVVGAAGGAAINLAFIHHFQKMADGHFTVRRLERKYGAETVRAAYDSIVA